MNRVEKLVRWFYNPETTLDDITTTDKLYLIRLQDFQVYKNEQGKLRLNDLQGANLGNIEEEEFIDLDDIIERMWSTYIVNSMEGEDEEFGIV